MSCACFAFGCATLGAGLGSFTGCIYPCVAESFAFGFATLGAGLRSVTGCISPFVSALSCIGVALSANGALVGFSIELVTGSRDFFLGCQDFFTKNALNTVGQTGFGTGRCFALNGGGDVTESRLNSGFYDNHATNGAVSALGRTGCGTGGINAGSIYFGVTESFAFGFATLGAGLGSCTGCFYPFVSAFIFYYFFFESSGEGDGACGSFIGVSRIIGVNHDLDFVACYNSDNCRVNNGIAVGPLSITVDIRSHVVDGVNPISITHGDGKSTVSSCSPGVEITVGTNYNSCLVLAENEVCRIFHSACGIGKVDNIILCLCSIVNESDYYRRSKETVALIVGSFAAVDANKHAAESACDVKSAVCCNVYSNRSFGLSIIPYEFGVERILFAFAGNGIGYFGLVGSNFRLVGRNFRLVGRNFGIVGRNFGRVGRNFGRVGRNFGLVGRNFGIRCFRSCCFFSRSCVNFFIRTTGSNGEHHNHDNNQGQDAQNVLFSHTRKPPFKIWSSAPWQHYIIIGKFLCDFS